MFVYVLDINGQPLMPTFRFGKVRKLLNSKQAKVIRRCPFTIKLLYEIDNPITQDITIGPDTGSKHIGVACVGNDKVLYQSQVELRDDIKNRMDKRRSHRRNRRTRKCRYRKPRFKNRANSTKKNRYSSTLRSKFDSHVKEIEFCKSILPVTKIIIETAKFDTQLLEKPWLQKYKWAYQKGINYGYANARAYVLDRDNYTCQCCGKKNVRLEVHHITFRSNNGSDDLDNLIALCKKCHDAIHDGVKELKLKGRRKSNLKYATQMSVLRSMLLRQYPEAVETYGYVTKANREALKLPKEHYLDAVVIASKGKVVELNDEVFYKKCVSRQDRSMTKGIRGEQRIPTGKILGFKKFDKVEYLKQEYFIKGRMSSGYAVLMDIFNNKVDFSYMPKGLKTPKLENCKRLSARKSVLIERRAIRALS